MTKGRYLGALCALASPLLLSILVAGCDRCNASDDDLETTTPSIAPPPVPPSASAEVTIEDAGAEAADELADADAADAKATVGVDPTGVRACCAALRSNAKIAPPQSQGSYLLAAATCDGLTNNAQGRKGLAAVRAMIAASGVPAECK